MSTKDFFDERTEQSERKADMVARYFVAWANIMIRSAKKYKKPTEIGYVDLFAGPGIYKDGQPSTPIVLLNKVFEEKSEDIRRNLHCYFNDSKSEFLEALQNQVANIPNLRFRLTHQPTFLNHKVEKMDTDEATQSGRIRPTLYFFDPWGYKGLSKELIRKAITPYGCDCIIFFNYKRIRAAIVNENFEEWMIALFGKGRLDKLRDEFIPVEDDVSKRREILLRHAKQALAEAGAPHVHHFLFHDDHGNPSHYLLFASTHEKGFDLSRNITASLSSGFTGGIPTHSFNPKIENAAQRSMLDDPRLQLEELGTELLSRFAGRTMSFEEVFRAHKFGTGNVEATYRAAIRQLEETGKISVDRSQQSRVAGDKLTYGPKVRIYFPKA